MVKRVSKGTQTQLPPNALHHFFFQKYVRTRKIAATGLGFIGTPTTLVLRLRSLNSRSAVTVHYGIRGKSIELWYLKQSDALSRKGKQRNLSHNLFYFSYRFSLSLDHFITFPVICLRPIVCAYHVWQDMLLNKSYDRYLNFKLLWILLLYANKL